MPQVYRFDQFIDKPVTLKDILETFVQAIQAVVDDNKRLDKENEKLSIKLIQIELRRKKALRKKRRKK